MARGFGMAVLLAGLVALLGAPVLTSSSEPERSPLEWNFPSHEPTPEETPKPLKVISIKAAVARLQPHVDVPVVLPDLPKGAAAAANRVYWYNVNGSRSGQVEVYLRPNHPSDPQSLWFQFGAGNFDGCGLDAALPTRLLGEPALIGFSSGWSTIIWPATLKHPMGTYGISGELDSFDLVRMAEQMERRSRVALRAQDGNGC